MSPVLVVIVTGEKHYKTIKSSRKGPTSLFSLLTPGAPQFIISSLTSHIYHTQEIKLQSYYSMSPGVQFYRQLNIVQYISCNSMFPIFPIWARQLFQYWLAHISIMVSRKPHTTGKPILELWASQYFQYSFTKTTHQNHTHNGNMGEPIMEIWASQNFQYGFTKTTHHR